MSDTLQIGPKPPPTLDERVGRRSALARLLVRPEAGAAAGAIVIYEALSHELESVGGAVTEAAHELGEEATELGIGHEPASGPAAVPASNRAALPASRRQEARDAATRGATPRTRL